MIKVKYTKNFDYIEVSGHANSAPYGKDLICASVSCIMTGLCNHLVAKCSIDNNRIIIDNGYVEIDVRGKMYIDVYIKLVITQIKTIQEEYPQYIEMEVIQ